MELTTFRTLEDFTIVHRTLQIIEVYERVYEAADRKSLAQLAQTCKTFYSTTKGALWRTIPNLSPLIRCFPTDSWLMAQGTMRTTRVILPHEWARFLENAQHVRVVGFNPVSQRPQLDVSAMETLIGLRPTIVLFPNIVALDSRVLLDGLKPEYLPVVLLMTGHKLKTLHIGSCGSYRMIPEAVFRASVSLSTTRFPNLQDVHFSAMEVTHERMQLETSLSITSFVSSLSSLRRFESSRIPLTMDAITFLVQLPTLRELSICLPGGVNWTALEQVPQPVGAWMKIRLSTTIQAYTKFAQAISLPHAEELTLWITDMVTRDSNWIVPFFIALRRQLSPTSLRSLTIRQFSTAGLAEARASLVVLRPPHLRPLLDFAGMERFTLALVCQSAFDAALLRDVARAWPRLVYLSLLCERFCASHSLPPLNALMPLAVHCPDLHTLRVVVYAASRQQDVDLGEFGGRASNSKLTLLDVGPSPIDNPATVAITIARMFPSLVGARCIVSGSFPEGTDPQGIFQAGWNEVRQYLPMFALVRQDERLRIAQGDAERGGG